MSLSQQLQAAISGRATGATPFTIDVEEDGQRLSVEFAALDTLLPDATIPLHDVANPDPAKSCDVPADESARQGSLHAELAQTLSRMIELYKDETVPQVTRSLGQLFQAIGSDVEAQGALARLDAREGYRPPPVALGVARPFFSYPRLEELSTSALRLLAKKSAGGKRAGKKTATPAS